MDIYLNVAEKHKNFIEDWNYEQQLSIGGYGSGKSYSICQKIIIKLLQEKRKVLVCRAVYESIKDSCFDLFHEILDGMNILSANTYRKIETNKVVEKISPMEFTFPNGSKIIFRGLDKVEKLKSLNGVSIVWIEECSEITQDAYIELLGRIRTPGVSLHFILSCNPVGKGSWVYRYFFVRLDNQGRETVVCDENELYKRGSMVCTPAKNQQVYIVHSTLDDNPFLPQSYIDRIDSLKEIDKEMWLVARWGRFGVTGLRVLPRFEVAKNAKQFKNIVYNIPAKFHFFGMDFGFEESSNAVMSCAVDDENKILYIYDEDYINGITDDVMIKREGMKKADERAKACKKYIKADCAEPKAIRYYQLQGFNMVACRKVSGHNNIGSRLQNTRKMKRFKKIVCSPKCKNCVRELSDLTYAKDTQGNVLYDKFTIDPHTFSALWYALDDYDVADIKQQRYNSRRG